MDWNSVIGIGVTGVLSALGYQAVKGDSWPASVNLLLGAIVAFGVGFTGIVDQLPRVTLEGNGASGVLAAFAASFAHGQLFRGKPLGQAVKLGLAPRVLSVLAQLTAGLSTAAKNEKTPTGGSPPPAP